MAPRVVLAVRGFAVRIPGWVEHEVHHHGVEDREVAKEGLKSDHRICASLSFPQVRARLVEKWQHGLDHLLHEGAGREGLMRDGGA